MGTCDVERLLLTLLPALAVATFGCDEPAKSDGGSKSEAKSGDAKASDAKADGGKQTGAPPKPVLRPEDELPSCPSGKWCGPRKAAYKVAVKKKPPSLGCAPQLGGSTEHAELTSDPVYEGLTVSASEMHATIDVPATEAKRATGDIETCCYNWVESCPGGRALVDSASVPVTAPTHPGSAWRGDSLQLEVDPEIAAEAAAQWLQDAAMEHASVGSFSRATLELMAVGAPPELLLDCQRAAIDEIDHAKACVEIAVACGGEPTSFGPLDVPPPRAADLARLAADTFVEGCVGETTAALWVDRAASAVSNEALRAVLIRIAKDETKHSALAWCTVRWAIETGGPSVLDAVLRRADELRATLPTQSAEPSPHRAALAQVGRLDAAAQDQARSDAWQGIVEPMLSGLSDESATA